MKHAILDLLSDKTVVLATHQLQLLHVADRIIWLQGGRIVLQDTYDSAMQNREFIQFKGSHDLITSTFVESTVVEARTGHIASKSLIQDEDSASSNVKLSVIRDYIVATGSIWNLVLVIVAHLISQILLALTGLWLGSWVSKSFGDFSDDEYIKGYVLIAFFSTFLPYAIGSFVQISLTRASIKMSQQALRCILRAPCSFFDAQPLGRILSRFIADVSYMDDMGTLYVKSWIEDIANVLGILLLASIVFPAVALAMIPFGALTIWVMIVAERSIRELRRTSTLQASKTHAKVQEGMSGMATIKSFNQEERFMEAVYEAMEVLQSSTFLGVATQAWLITWCNSINILLVFLVGVLVVKSSHGIDPSVGGFVLVQATNLCWTFRRVTDMHDLVGQLFHAVERIDHYCKDLEQEKVADCETPLHASWPDKGELSFEQVDLRYRPETPIVLSGFSIQIPAGQKIGIVGRTGAGKSSILVALFRMVELARGRIMLDGIDLGKLDLETLRSRMSIIPQDPLLFEGDIRKNLDPFSRHTDEELCIALAQVRLCERVDDDETGKPRYTGMQLDYNVQAQGSNISHGQRQQLSLCRALLSRSNIVVLDEATSNIDPVMDALIQERMMTLFANKTVISIAHRLKSVLAFDRIVVMDAGRAVEVGSPVELWDQEEGIFRSMCTQSGISREMITKAVRV